MFKKLTFYNKEIVSFIEPSAKVISRKRNCSTGVFEVEIKGKRYILKIASECCNFGFDHLKTDILVMKTCQDVPGIPKIYDTFYKEGYLGMLREPIGGEEAYKLSPRRKSCLEKTVRELHKRGFARLDLCPNNIIIPKAPKSLPYIVDLGHALLAKDLKKRAFGRARRDDLKIIERYNRCFPRPRKGY